MDTTYQHPPKAARHAFRAGCMFFIMSCVLFVWAQHYSGLVRLATHGERAIATATKEIGGKRGFGVLTRSLEYRFVDAKGRNFAGRVQVVRLLNDMQPGDKLEVMYDPARPSINLPNLQTSAIDSAWHFVLVGLLGFWAWRSVQRYRYGMPA